MKKERLGINNDRCRLEERLLKVKDVLPLAEQIMRLKVGIGELFAFHSAVYEKADMERYHLILQPTKLWRTYGIIHN
jgi:hypothetical protein